MKGNTVWKPRYFSSALVLAVLAVTVLAGTPLICTRFDVGGAKSLPWNAGGNWNSPDPGYNTGHLVDDTVRLLVDGTPVIVRMETIRRAVLYAANDPSLSGALLTRFAARAARAGQGKPDALRIFDCGYLIETLKQASLMNERRELAGAVAAKSGYQIIREALQLRGNDPEMEFAAAVVSVWPRRAEHEEHFRKAVAGAASDPLLAKNLLEHFSDRGGTLAQLRASADMIAKKD